MLVACFRTVTAWFVVLITVHANEQAPRILTGSQRIYRHGMDPVAHPRKFFRQRATNGRYRTRRDWKSDCQTLLPRRTLIGPTLSVSGKCCGEGGSVNGWRWSSVDYEDSHIRVQSPLRELKGTIRGVSRVLSNIV